MDDEYACFNCDNQGGGYYKPHEGKTRWYIGHTNGQGHYACEECKDMLFDALPLDEAIRHKKATND